MFISFNPYAHLEYTRLSTLCSQRCSFRIKYRNSRIILTTVTSFSVNGCQVHCGHPTTCVYPTACSVSHRASSFPRSASTRHAVTCTLRCSNASQITAASASPGGVSSTPAFSKVTLQRRLHRSVGVTYPQFTVSSTSSPASPAAAADFHFVCPICQKTHFQFNSMPTQ